MESIEDYLTRMARLDEETDCAAHDSDDDRQPPAPPARAERRLEDEATPQIRIRTLSADKAYGTTDYLQALCEQGIVPLVSLRNLLLEDTPACKRQTNDPERQRKRLAKIQEVHIRNRVKRIQLTGSCRHLQKLRTRCEHVFAESKVAHGMDRARSRGLDCMQEQALLTAIVQNLKRLCRLKKKATSNRYFGMPKTEIRDDEGSVGPAHFGVG